MKTRMTRLFGLALAASVSLAVSAAANAQHLVQVPGGNPVIAASGNHVTGVTYDQWGRPMIHRHQDQVHASAMDPNRGYVDPGSLQYVNEIRYDRHGRPYRVQGYRWTSYGVRHGNLTSSWVNSYPQQTWPNAFVQPGMSQSVGTIYSGGGSSQSVTTIRGGRPGNSQSVQSFFRTAPNSQSQGFQRNQDAARQIGQILNGVGQLIRQSRGR